MTDMTAVNKGVTLLNDPSLREGDPAVFCVLGIPGGGTTMTARLLEGAGISMGERTSFSAEDIDIAAVLRSPTPNVRKFRTLVARRNAANRRWGFKSPLRHHWNLLSSIGNVRYAVIFRDLVAVGMRSAIDSPDQVLKRMVPILNLQKAILESISSTNRPILLASYEKALLDPETLATQMLIFAGAEETPAKIAELKAIIQPNEPRYVAEHQRLRQTLEQRR